MTALIDTLAADLDADHWFDEIDLDPSGAWRRMGSRSLGTHPLFVADQFRSDELAYKQHLLSERHADVFRAEVGTEAAAEEMVALVLEAMRSIGLDASPQAGLHPLDAAGRLVQEDLCLLIRRDGDDGPGWYLDAASLCFPSRWALADKIGRHLDLVHAPVEGYTPTLNGRVSSLFDSLTDRPDSRPVRRRNWFIHPGLELFQPSRPAEPEPLIPADRVLDDMSIRTERQVMFGLDTRPWAVFTIRVQQAPLRRFLAQPERAAVFARYIAEADEGLLAHRGINAEQRMILAEALTTG